MPAIIVDKGRAASCQLRFKPILLQRRTCNYFLGVYMFTDGGLSWNSINEGLSTKAITALILSNDG